MTTNHYHPDGERQLYGGAERYGLELTRLLLDLGYEVEWWQVGEGWVREILPGVPIRSIRENSFSYQTMPALNQAFHARANVDYALYFVAFLAYPEALPRSLAISHGIYWDYPGFDVTLATDNDREEWRRRMLLALAGPRRIVSVDTATIQWVNSSWPGLGHKLVYIPNFVDLQAFGSQAGRAGQTAAEVPGEAAEGDEPAPEPILGQPGGGRPVRVLFPRRMVQVRGLNEAARAAEVLTARYENIEFHFVGRFHDEGLEKEFLRWAGSHRNIYYYWLPPHAMPRVYRAVDLVLIPSRSTEGTSLSCLEGMAAGRSVIATWVGGLTDLIIDGFNGRLIPPDGQALVEAIEELGKQPALRRQLGENARQVARAFSLERWRQRWSQVLEEVFTP